MGHSLPLFKHNAAIDARQIFMQMPMRSAGVSRAQQRGLLSRSPPPPQDDEEEAARPPHNKNRHRKWRDNAGQ